MEEVSNVPVATTVGPGAAAGAGVGTGAVAGRGGGGEASLRTSASWSSGVVVVAYAC
jgi:hypothetical protein